MALSRREAPGLENVDELPQPASALPQELTPYIGYLVRRVFASFSERAGTPPSEMRDFSALSCLNSHGAMHQQEFMLHLGINRNAVTKLIDRLVRCGWVERAPSGADRRTNIVALTESGRQRLAEDLRVRESVSRDLMYRFDDDQIGRLHAHVEDLLRSYGLCVEPRDIDVLMARLHAELHRRSDGKLIVHELRARWVGPLSAIHSLGPWPQHMLAEHLAITEAATTQMVDTLSGLGLVRRVADRADRRRHLLVLTDLGRERLVTIRAAVDELQREIESVLGPERTEDLRMLLMRLLD